MRREELALAKWLAVMVVMLSRAWAAAPSTPPVYNAKPFDALLRANVHDGRPDVAALKGSAALAACLDHLAHAAEPTTAAEREAYGLNAYNALCLATLTEHWPATSAVAIDGFFDRLEHTLSERTTTLDALENDKLRPIGDPRVHCALYLGARGGAALRAEAYDPERLEVQLEEQAKAWVNDRRNVRYDAANHLLLTSLLFRWYAVDFEALGGPAGFATKYLADPAVKTQLAAGSYGIVTLPFDWSL
jgi:hypothetical protein